MNGKVKALLFSASILLAGCWQKSVHPFYLPDQVIFEPRLVGKWTSAKPGESASWTFSQERGKTYRVFVQDGDDSAEFQGHLFTLDGGQWLDLHSRERRLSEIPAHHVLRIEWIDNTLQLRILSSAWIRNRLKEYPKEIDHILVTDPVHPDDPDKTEAVLTARTAHLQRFIRKHLDTGDAFEEAARLQKVE